MTQKAKIEAVRWIIATGYIFVAVIICILFYIWGKEWNEVEKMEYEIHHMDSLRKDIHSIYFQLMDLSYMGESIISWDSDALNTYKSKRVETDSMLAHIKPVYPRINIENIRKLLEQKESLLGEIMKIIIQQDSVNDKLFRKMPIITRQSATENPKKKSKRTGFLGLFGKKEEPSLSPTTIMLESLNRDIIQNKQEQKIRLSVHMDSLTVKNDELNLQLQSLIHEMDRNVQYNMQLRESSIVSLQEKSLIRLGIFSGVILLLLIGSFVVIHIDIKKRDIVRQKLQESIRQNNSLLEMRKKIILTIPHDIRNFLHRLIG